MRRALPEDQIDDLPTRHVRPFRDPLRGVADSVMKLLAGVLIHVFFRRLEVENADVIKPGIPTVLVANHTNGLVDGLLLMAALRRYPRFLGKSTLFRIAPLWPFLKLAGVVPIFRASDGMSTDQNENAFVKCRQLLHAGGMVALFPEGISHDEPHLQPLKTGAARIALGSAGKDSSGVATVAVGLAYDDKARFRSRALVRVGEPVPVRSKADPDGEHDHSAVRALTDDMSARLRVVSPDYDSWVEAQAFGRIAEIVERPFGSETPGEVDLNERERVARGLNEIAGQGTPRNALLIRLREAFDRYEADLSVLGLSDAQVTRGSQTRHLRGQLALSIIKVVIALPMALIGAMIHAVPYQMIKRVARLPRNEGMKATVKLLGCFASFTLLYIALAIAVGLRGGAVAGLLTFGGAPACGYVTVLFSERVKRIGGAVQGAHLIRDLRGGVLDTVLADREAVVAEAQGLLAAR